MIKEILKYGVIALILYAVELLIFCIAIIHIDANAEIATPIQLCWYFNTVIMWLTIIGWSLRNRVRIFQDYCHRSSLLVGGLITIISACIFYINCFLF